MWESSVEPTAGEQAASEEQDIVSSTPTPSEKALQQQVDESLNVLIAALSQLEDMVGVVQALRAKEDENPLSVSAIIFNS